MNDPVYKQLYVETVDNENEDAPVTRDVYFYLVAVLFAVLLIGLG